MNDPLSSGMGPVLRLYVQEFPGLGYACECRLPGGRPVPFVRRSQEEGDVLLFWASDMRAIQLQVAAAFAFGQQVDVVHLPAGTQDTL